MLAARRLKKSPPDGNSIPQKPGAYEETDYEPPRQWRAISKVCIDGYADIKQPEKTKTNRPGCEVFRVVFCPAHALSINRNAAIGAGGPCVHLGDVTRRKWLTTAGTIICTNRNLCHRFVSLLSTPLIFPPSARWLPTALRNFQRPTADQLRPQPLPGLRVACGES